MKNFKQFVAEVVEEPKGDDEKRFKALHQVEVIDKLEYDSESIFKGDIVSKDMTRLADKHSPEDAMTYDTAYESEELGEGEEQLDEISKSKIKDYMDKAKKNADVNFEVSTYAGSRKRMAKDAGDSERADKLDKLQKKTDSTLERRAKGLRSASRLLRAKRGVKEDIYEEHEELNELSKGKLKDYADKAKEDNYQRFTGRGKHERPPAPASAYDKRSGARGGSRGPSKLKPSHYNKPEIKAAREKIQKKLDSRKSFIKKAEDKLKESMTLEVGIDLVEASKTKKLDKINIVYYDASSSDAAKFANDYVKGQIGDYREGGPKGADEANSEKFWMEYDIQSTRRGFAGSGTTVYTNKKTGKRFEVNRVPNGKGFHGTDHHVKALSISESNNVRIPAKGGKLGFENGRGEPLARENVAGRGGRHPNAAYANYVAKVTQTHVGDNLDESIKVGSLKLDDGSSITVSKSDAELLNWLKGELDSKNWEAAEKELKGSKKGYSEIIDFAKATKE